MSQIIDDIILEKIIALCDDVAWGRSIAEDTLYSYTAEGQAPENLSRLAEAFGFMLVKLAIREEYSHRLIQELQEKNNELALQKEYTDMRNSQLMGIVQDSSRRIIGQCELMQKCIKMALSVARRPVNTMLLGETGTGKEEFAKLIHFSSTRREGPFVAVNCSAIPDSLFESEMFGIEKGVATGVSKKKGLLEEASGGTLFLDEISDMPLTHQAKILRVLEEQEVTRVGSAKPISIDIKVISAANINLEKAVQNGKFRMDLFYRLNVAEINIPPLRERGEDILLLAQRFLDYHCTQMKQNRLTLSPEAKEALFAYRWPGNVRELNNEMERAVVLTMSQTVEFYDLSQKIQNANTGKSTQIVKPVLPSFTMFSTPKEKLEEAFKRTDLPELESIVPPKREESKAPKIEENKAKIFNLAEIEKDCINQALKETDGNRSKAANLLGITREGLRKKLLRMGLEEN